jgi:tetratricopeptide (TPR) repeat protein
VKAAERQKLKHDKYAETVVSGLQWAKVHQSKVIAVAAAVVIVAAAVVWIIHTRIQAQQEARAQLTECQMSADQALTLKDDARTEAIKDALAHLDTLVKSYPDSEVAPQAVLQAAELLSAAGQAAKAADYYQRLLEMSGAPEGMKTLARRGLAASLEQSGDVEKAIAQYKALAAASSPREAVEADWDIGRCYDQFLKDPENAKTYYRKAIADGGDSTWAELARFRLESLERGPTPPESAASAPATTAAAPATTDAAPAVTASEPATTGSAPAMTAAAPETAGSAPATTASEPETTASTPSSTTSTPAATTAPSAE